MDRLFLRLDAIDVKQNVIITKVQAVLELENERVRWTFVVFVKLVKYTYINFQTSNDQ